MTDLTEEVLHARGLECDDRISKLSEQKLIEILEEEKNYDVEEEHIIMCEIMIVGRKKSCCILSNYPMLFVTSEYNLNEAK